MSINPTTNFLNQTAVSPQAREAPSGTLGKDDFLKLLVGQLRHQDPLNPREDAEFMGQMAQFSALEQLSNVSKTLEVDRAFSLINRSVTYKDKDGGMTTGTVEKVVLENGKPTLTIGGKGGIDPTAVVEVK